MSLDTARMSALLLLMTTGLLAGPVEFGREQLTTAINDKGLKFSIETELNLDPPGTFRIIPLLRGVRVSGGDLRGLMYGLLEATLQIRNTGKFAAATFKPVLLQRGVRMTPSDTELAAPDYFLADRWRNYFRMLAQNRINRFAMVLPPAAAELERIRFLSSTANEYGVDFILGIRGPLGSPALQAQLRELLDESVLVRGVQIQPGSEPIDFYLNVVFNVIKATGRRVTLDLHGSESRPQLPLAAIGLGIPVTLPPGSKLGDADYDVHILIPAPDPEEGIESVRVRIKALVATGINAFEIDAPSAQPEQHPRFYQTWGLVSYDQ